MLDAFRDEPLPPDSPFYDLENVIITPHTSWSSGRVLDRSIELFCENLRRFRTRRAAAQRGRSGRRLLMAVPVRRLPELSMEIAIVGLAASGKTTVFNTLTRGHAETGGYGGMTVNVGVVKVPDARLTQLTELFKPKREVPADVTYVDLPAPPADRGRHGQRPAGRRAGPPAQRRRAAPRRARLRGPGRAAPVG